MLFFARIIRLRLSLFEILLKVPVCKRFNFSTTSSEISNQPNTFPSTNMVITPSGNIGVGQNVNIPSKLLSIGYNNSGFSKGTNNSLVLSSQDNVVFTADNSGFLKFGKSIGKFQGISFQLADMITEIDAADLLTLNSAWKLDQGLNANREIASAKLYASEMLARVTDVTLQIHGGMGLMNDYPIERFWRDARVERIWDGTSEIQKHIISRELLRPLGS